MSSDSLATDSATASQHYTRRLRRMANPDILLWLSASVLLLFITLPLVAIFIRAIPSGSFGEALKQPVVRQALKLSLTTTAISLGFALLAGTPVAWLLARRSFRGRAFVETVIDLPMVLPPAVAGVALLMAFGRRGILGPFLSNNFGIELPFTTAAVVIAQAFVATPFFVRSAQSGFESIDRSVEHVAATLGASRIRSFCQVTVPMAAPALLGGAVMAWARALGEFGATIMFAGNFAGRTQTMPLAIYQTMESGRLDASLALSGILVIVSFTVLFIFKALARHAANTGGPYART